jgi:Flp pilus assembly protein TadB|tara:strand:- start:4208 stop:4426 length:219 start_codon:yes stop_codon:yes gene_type:complete
LKNLGDTILFSLSVVLFVIGVHQTMTFGMAASYFIFMLSLGLLFLVRYRRAKRKENEKQQTTPSTKKKKPRA